MTAPTIEPINREDMLALTNEGATVPITALLDDDGEPTEAWADARLFVAGRNGVWFLDSVAAYADATIQ